MSEDQVYDTGLLRTITVWKYAECDGVFIKKVDEHRCKVFVEKNEKTIGSYSVSASEIVKEANSILRRGKYVQFEGEPRRQKTAENLAKCQKEEAEGKKEFDCPSCEICDGPCVPGDRLFAWVCRSCDETEEE